MTPKGRAIVRSPRVCALRDPGINSATKRSRIRIPITGVICLLHTTGAAHPSASKDPWIGTVFAGGIARREAGAVCAEAYGAAALDYSWHRAAAHPTSEFIGSGRATR